MILINLVLALSCESQALFNSRLNASDSLYLPAISTLPLPFQGWHQAEYSKSNKIFSTSIPITKNSRSNYSSIDTCATYTYRLKIGNTGREETVNQVTTISGGNILLTGKVRNTGFPYDALLMKLNPDGSTLWSKSFGDASSHEEFAEARNTSDGGIIVIGTSYPVITGDGWIVICKMDNSGNPQWTRRLKTPLAGTIARGVDIVEMTDGNFLFIGDNSTSVLFGKLTSTGSLTWSRSASPFQTLKALRIIEDYNGHFLAITGTDNGYNVASIFKVSLADGSFVWNRQFGGPAMTSNYIFHSVEMINLRPRITAIYAPVGQPYKFIRISVNTGSLIEKIEEYSAPGLSPDISSMSGQVATSQALAFSNSNNSNSINLVRNSIDQSVTWSYNLNNPTTFTLASIDKSFDAGFLIACNMGDDIFLVKTDSAGLNPGCDITESNTNWTGTFNPSIPNPSFAIVSNIPQESTTPLDGSVILLDTFYYCKQLTCPPRPAEDSCLASFHKTYRSYEFAENATGIIETPDNHVMITGYARQDSYEPSSQMGIVAKLTKKGDLVRKERWLMGSNSTFYKQIKLGDGNSLVSGYANDNGFIAFTLTKFDQNLNIIWNKMYRLIINNPSEHIDIAESADGEIFLGLLYKDFPNLNDKICINKLDNNGNLIWQKTYRNTTGISILGNGSNMSVAGDFLYCNTMTLINNKWFPMVVKIDKAGGAVIWSKTYAYGTSTSFRLTQAMRIRNNKIYLSGNLDYVPGEYDPVLMRLNQDGDVEKMTVHRLPGYTYRYKFTISSNGDIVISDYIYSFAVTPPVLNNYFLRLDSNFNIINSKKSADFGNLSTNQLVESIEGDFFATGLQFYDDPYNIDIFLKRHLSNGTLGSCSSDSLILPAENASPTVTNISFSQSDISALQMQPPVLTVTAFSLQQSQILCGSISGCDTIWLEGTNIICDSVNQYVFRAKKNSGCFAPVTWNVGSPTIQVIQSNDSLIRVRFLQNGAFMIKAKMYSGCQWLEDSISVQVLIAPDTLNLGPDSTLCPNNTQVLNAHSGYLTYLWQDNSTDSTFTIISPGLYWVEVTDACNNTYRDTVIVTASPPVPLDLGPDLSKCNNDSLTITAPPDFINYTWSPNYNITTTNGPVVTVFPSIDTIYSLIAEKTPGCFAFDSIRVTVKNSPAIYLGADTSFCSGDSIFLNTGPGFTNYQWNTGQISPSIVVYSAGNYSINALAANGCRSMDTLIVLNVFSRPVVNLGPDASICEGTDRQLDAGAGFTAYLWNNGNTTQFLNAGNAGTYWVVVTDNNQCKGGDTTVITAILPIPKNFLPPDTALCFYSSISLKPLSTYNSYLWSTGSNSSTIVVSNPGNYWLQVIAANGCSGKDTIIVNPKQCLEGFYIPNAFTPNNDGKNDLFKPLLFGNVLKYEFSVYNRWGEKIFNTKDLQKGWNGKVGGTDTDSNIFVWQCTFQFVGKKAELRKGTVALIR